MEFSPFNDVVKLCLQGMAMEESGKHDEASRFFQQAWHDGTNDSEKFLAAHYLARQQQNVTDRLHWLHTALQLALKVNDSTVNSALPSLYLSIAQCYQEMEDELKAKEY